MLDQQNCLALVAQLAQEAAKRLAFDTVHSGSGLIEQQQFWLRGQRAGNFQPPLISLRQAACLVLQIRQPG
jgi:hypothetical protein